MIFNRVLLMGAGGKMKAYCALPLKRPDKTQGIPYGAVLSKPYWLHSLVFEKSNATVTIAYPSGKSWSVKYNEITSGEKIVLNALLPAGSKITSDWTTAYGCEAVFEECPELLGGG